MEKLYDNGKIYLEAGRFASALWVRDGRVYRVGGPELARQAAGVERVDLKGATVVPGFNDSHLHLLDVGRYLTQVDLFDADSPAEMARRCRAFLDAHPLEEGQTLVGNGWNQDRFREPVMPTKADLDALVPERPVVLNRVCGHILVCNSAALAAVGITPDTPVPPGGSIDWQRGILGDNAIALLDPILPPDSAEGCKAAYRAVLGQAAACGITTAQSCDPRAGDWPAVLEAVRQLDEAGELPLRLHLQCSLDTPEHLADFLRRFPPRQGGCYWRVGALKLFADGSLGSRTALLRGDYADDPQARGLDCLDLNTARPMLAMANERGLPVVVHAIGDGAIQKVLDLFGEGDNPCRNGIVHCQITTPDLWERFARGHVLALVQPIFLDYDHTIAAARCGEALAATSYAFGTAARMGVAVSYGTDAPVESFRPFPNLYTAITRCPLGSDTPWHPGEQVSRETALDLYTVGSAYAEGEEHRKGRLLPGYLADFAVLDRDYFTVPVREIPHIQVVRTVMDGREVFCR